MSEFKPNKRMDNVARIISVALCGAVFASTFFVYPHVSPKDDSVTALAETKDKDFKWSKQAVEKGTTVDAKYLWPDETNPLFTAVYRDGQKLNEDKMVTIADGSVYHFRGISEDSILYTQVYVGISSELDVTSGETGTWYRLLPSKIREDFEGNGWTWENGWEYSGRAYMDKENSRIMIKDGDYTAVLYGIGLYLDDKHDYNSSEAMAKDGDAFENVFGDTDNRFASALEYYYTRGGELNSKFPEIYALITNAMEQMGAEPAHAASSGGTEEGPGLMSDLLEYVNTQRAQAGLNPAAWDKADDENIIRRMKEIKEVFSQTRPDGSDAFSAYTDAVMCEVRLEDIGSVQDVYECAATYFLMPEMTSFSCAVYGDIGVLIFVW